MLKNKLVVKKSESFDKLDEALPESTRCLGVDAVIKYSYAYEKTGSEGAAIVKTY
jgi:hypothetical protein